MKEVLYDKVDTDDCLEVMPKLIDEGVKVDMVLTDPPYLMNYHSGWIKDKSHDFRTPILNDTNFELISDVVPLLYRLLKRGGFICSAIVIM